MFTPLKELGCRVWVFGSRTCAGHHPFSDLDVLYSCPSDLPLGRLSEIKEAIENSDITMAVDLVDERHLAESYRKLVLQQKIEV